MEAHVGYTKVLVKLHAPDSATDSHNHYTINNKYASGCILSIIYHSPGYT